MTQDASRWQRVAGIDEFGAQRKLLRSVSGLEILLCRLGADVVAIHNACTHLGQPLDRGRLMAGQLTCPFHGACFDLASGKPVSGPAVLPLRRYPVKVESGTVFVDVRAV